MQQSSFNFGPSHNTKDPNTSTASSSGMDDLVSKLSSLLMVSNNKDQLENTLKKAVKDGIIEANKEDVRVSDSEERDAERRHKELMQHLNRIASLGGSNKPPSNFNTEEKSKENSGFGLFDALKWGGIAAGVLTLVSNFDSLSKVFDETTNKTVGMINTVDNFGSTIKKLTDNAFSEKGAIGMLIGAFLPGGLLAKGIFSILGGAITGSIGSQSNTPNVGTTRLPITGTSTETNNGTNGLPINNPSSSSSGMSSFIPSVDVNPIAATAAVIASRGGGSAKGRLIKGLAAYGITEYLAPEYDEFGNPKESLFSKAKRSVTDVASSVNPYNPDGSINQNVAQGAVVGGLAGVTAARMLPKNKFGFGLAGVAAITGYDIANPDVDVLKSVKNKFGLPSLPDMSTVLGITPPENEYNKRIKEYDEEIAKLKKEQESTGVGSSISRKDYLALSSEERSKKLTELKTKKIELKTRIKELEKSKESFNTSVSDNNLSVLSAEINKAPDNPNAGESSYFSMETGAFMLAGAGFGLMSGGPAGAAFGAAAAGVSSSAFTYACNTIEEYIEKKFKKKVDILQLAFENPTLVGNILVEYAKDDPVGSATTLGVLTVGILNPKGGAKALMGIAKNIPKFGQKVSISGGMGVVKSATNYNIAAGAGLLKPAAIAGLGVAASNSIGNQYDILGSSNDITNVLNTGNSNLPQLSITGGNVVDPLAPTPRERIAMGKNDEPIPSGIPVNPSGQPTPVNADTSAFRTTGDILSGKRAAGHVDVANLNADYATRLAAFIKDAEEAFGDKIQISSAYRPPTQKEKDALRSTATTQEELFRNRKPGGAPVAAPYKSNHGFGDGSDIYLKKFRSANGMNTMTSEQLKQWKALAAQHQLNIGDKFGENWHVYGNDGRKSQELRGEEYANYISKNSLSSAIGGNYSGLGNQGPMGDLVGQILGTESRGGDINAFWGDSSGKYNDLLGGKKISEMTFGELREFQKNLTQRTTGHVPDTDKGTSAVGIGQWVGSTLYGQDYNNTGFLKEYFGNQNYDNVVFDEARQKDMFARFLKSDNHGKMGKFVEGNAGNPEEYAQYLGSQWAGVKPEKEQKRLVETLKKIKATPVINVDDALDKVMASMSNLSEKSSNFKQTFDGLAKQVGDSLNSISDFLSNVTKKAGDLLPKEFKDLFDIPAMKEFLDPFLGGESKSTLAHPKRTFSSLESKELRDLLLGPSEETGESSDVKTYPYDRTKVNIVANPSISGEQLAANSSALKTAEQRASQQNLGSIINMSSGNGGEAIHGQQIAGLSGNINTHFPGDIDAISARIYQWTDAPMFYASGKLT